MRTSICLEDPLYRRRADHITRIRKESKRTVSQKQYMLQMKWMIVHINLYDPGGKTKLFVNLYWIRVSVLQLSSSVGTRQKQPRGN